MGLIDVARLITTHKETQENLITLLKDIGEHYATKEDLLDSTRFTERYLRHLIGKLVKFEIVRGKTINGERKYFLTPDSFRTFLKVKYAEAIEHLLG